MNDHFANLSHFFLQPANFSIDVIAQIVQTNFKQFYILAQWCQATVDGIIDIG